jgi:acetylornithine deacetylase/succinyl-diaminopimelate desuccinylase-like protein
VIAADLRTQTSELLAGLIQIDTTNPPGNETAAAEYLAAHLAAAGVEATLVGRSDARQNLVARLRGRGEGPSLMLLGHTDVVPADPREWSVPPFSGLDRDGHIWGRGALDMKGQVAAETAAFAALAREGWDGAGDLILCAVADEEVGDGWGLAWLVEEHPDLVRADLVLNEGGGERVSHRGRVAYTIAIGEKMCSAFRITTGGRSGHASVPSVADNAVLRMLPVIERLERMERPGRELPELALFVEALAGPGADPHELLRDARAGNPVLAAMIEPLLGATIAPTVIEAGSSVNVIPNRAELVCDSRILPGMSQAELERAVRSALSGLEYEFEFVEKDGGTISPVGTDLYAALERYIGDLEPGAVAAPLVSAGFTDSHWMREAFGSVAYGFMPSRMDPALAGVLIHSADERAAKDDLELAATCFMRLAREIGGA